VIGLTPLSKLVSVSDPYTIEAVMRILESRGFDIELILGEWAYALAPKHPEQPTLHFIVTGIEAIREVVLAEDEFTTRVARIVIRCEKTECTVDVEEYVEEPMHSHIKTLKSKRIKMYSRHGRAPVNALEKTIDRLLSIYEK